MSEEDSRLTLTRLVFRLPPGPDLDKLVAMVIFDMRTEPCDEGPSPYHLVGSCHNSSGLGKGRLCASPLPGFSTDWAVFKVVLEWLVARYPGAEIVWDCQRWSCNVSSHNEDGEWFRLSSVSGVAGLQEAVCKAALLSLINPQVLPLEFRSTVASAPTKRKGRRKRK